MICRMNSQMKYRPAFNLMESLRRYLKCSAPALLPHYSRSLHIALSLNCRLSHALKFLHAAIEESLQLSKGKNHSSKPLVTLCRQRVIASNQFDNLSPPLVTPDMVLLKLN